MTMLGGGPQIEVVSAPALAELYRRMLTELRWRWQWERPFAVEPELYQRASAEMDQVMRDRGIWMLSADIDRPNFLFKGVPIVMGD